MQDVISFINGIQVYILLGLVFFIIVLLILVNVLFSSLNKVEKRYRKLMRGANNGSLEELVVSYLDKIDNVKEYVNIIKQSNIEMDINLKKCIQKLDIVRFKAFENVGSDLSFSVALLDGNDDGVVLTGIYGRNESTTYAKPINKGVSRYDLSEEEKNVLDNAINKK